MSDNVPKGYKSYRDELKTIEELPEEYQDREKQKHIILYTTEPQPELAISPFERLTECMVTLAIHNIIQATPGYPARLVQPKSCAYRIAPSPGAGLGVFATRPLAEGDLIMSERAIIIAPAILDAAQPDMHTMGLSDEEQRAITKFSVEKQLRFIFERLRPNEQANYMALANNFSDCGPLWGRLQTNGFGLRNLNSAGTMENLQGACAGVFDKVSRINHSCGPNTHRRFHIPSLSMRIYAVRDIAKGEELTLTYNGEWETAARQKSAQKYGFQCRCPSCLDAKASDQRRKRIAEEYCESAVNQWIQAIAVATGMRRRSVLPGILHYAEEGIHLIEIEGLQAHHCYRHVLMCMLCVLAAIGNAEERFRKYGLLLLKKWIAEGWNLGRRFEEFQKNIRNCSRLRDYTAKE